MLKSSQGMVAHNMVINPFFVGINVTLVCRNLPAILEHLAFHTFYTTHVLSFYTAMADIFPSVNISLSPLSPSITTKTIFKKRYIWK